MADSAISPAWRYFQSASSKRRVGLMFTWTDLKTYIQTSMGLLTVLQHLHDVLFDHGQNDLSSQATGNPVQSALPSNSIAGGK